MPSYHNEKWIKLYRSALVEWDRSLMPGRIADAREEIVKRLEALRDIPGSHDVERNALRDALSNLRVLERE